MAAAACNSDYFGSGRRSVVANDVCAFSSILLTIEDHIVGPVMARYGEQTLAQRAGTNQARLRVITQHLFDSIEDAVIDTLTERHKQRPGGLDQFDRNNLEALQQQSWNRGQTNGRDGGCIAQHGAGPLASQGNRDLLFGNEAKFLQPFADFLGSQTGVTRSPLGFKRGTELDRGELLAREQNQAQRNSVRREDISLRK